MATFKSGSWAAGRWMSSVVLVGFELRCAELMFL
jgi:hypothetical protein